MRRPTWLQRPPWLQKWRWVVFAAGTAILMFLRSAAIGHAWVVGGAAARSVTVGVAGLIAAWFVAVVQPRPSVSDIAAAAAIATAFFGLAETVSPTTPDAQQAPACQGAQVHAVRYLATTTARGANARSGAGRSFSQVFRYTNGCTLGFVGYCLGEPADDIVFGTPDFRWLIMPGRHKLVSASAVLAQSAEDRLPYRRCKGDVDRPTAMSIDPPSGAVVTPLRITATGRHLGRSASPCCKREAVRQVRPNSVWTRHPRMDSARYGLRIPHPDLYG
jgi:hypothetical protein